MLGPAVIVQSTVSVDGEVVDVWNASTADRIRERLPVHPSAVTFNQAEVLKLPWRQLLPS
ncbi:hypothetical protein ACZ90_32810 [Streptomyces albus subsp. albus]|nr:hypothetical protein ACZ90_32810 [Streptomyces albus subsp. albus]